MGWMVVVLLQVVICSIMLVSSNSLTIMSEDGDIIDCVDIYKQPAFDHPALKHHEIQMMPSEAAKSETNVMSGEEGHWSDQRWRKNGTCPKGSIPIRRQNKRVYLLKQNHSMAILHADGFAYLGGKGDMKVWNPHVESDDEFSTSRVALKIGGQPYYEAVESGWAVNPQVYGDRKTRLYTYWTVDGSNSTGCFDLTCPGFVQTSNEIALGAAIYPISNPTGLTYQITIYLHKDLNTSNWWVQYNEDTNIGYFPAELFRQLRFHAATVQWGGEVYSPTGVGKIPHTTTAMGSGRFPDFVGQSSGYMKRIRVLEYNNILRYPQWITILPEEYFCYQTYLLSDYIPEPEFYFGGPGRNYMCP